jgi:hypothetical protein
VIGWIILGLLAFAAVFGVMGLGDRNDGRQVFWLIGGALAGLATAILIGASIWRLM